MAAGGMEMAEEKPCETNRRMRGTRVEIKAMVSTSDVVGFMVKGEANGVEMLPK